jgi:tight adherence protein C
VSATPGRLLVLSGIPLWLGTTLLLSRLGWFGRTGLAERLRPYGPAEPGGGRRPEVLSVASFRDVVGPLARAVGERISGALGVHDDLSVRLERAHWPLDATAFRMRQLAWSLAGAGAGALAATATRPPAPVAVVFLLGGPALAFLVLEQRLSAAAADWQRRVFLELPVVIEQLAMLLDAGYSLGAALNRLATRGRGACATDLARVCGRVRQGLNEVEAVREWAAVARVPALDRLVPVLALNRETADLGRLLSEEARAVRRDVQRRLIATIERRGQQVWIPVTVATLVPGVILMGVPFLEALRLFAGAG